MNIVDLVIFYAVCIIGWKCFEKLRIPTPAILGPIFAVGFANIMGLSILVPGWLSPLLSIILGIILGVGFNLKLKGMLKEILLMAAWIIILSVIAGRVLIFTGLSESTALFSAMPGGIVELSLMSMSFDANIFEVALLHTSRIIIAMVLLPLMLRKKEVGKENIQIHEEVSNIEKKTWLFIIIIGVGSAYIFGLMGIPANYLIGSMIGVGIFIKTKNMKVQINKGFQKFIQSGVGGLIGFYVTKESVMSIPDYIIPIICLNILIVGGSIGMGYFLYKITDWSLTTCLLAASPAGVMAMVILSMECEGDTPRVAIFQMLRLATCIIAAPIMAQLFLSG